LCFDFKKEYFHPLGDFAEERTAMQRYANPIPQIDSMWHMCLAGRFVSRIRS
jgi:hypothetical protein